MGDILNSTLAEYGARITPDGRLAKGDKVLGVTCRIARGRLYFGSHTTGAAIASAPLTARGIREFVESFYYWERIK